MKGLPTLADLLRVGSDLSPALVQPHGASTAGGDHPASVTFGELRTACASIGHHLGRIGCTQGSCVALLAPHSIETAAAMLGLTAGGWVAAPLNPSLGANSIKFILKDTKAKLLLIPPIEQADSSEAVQAARNVGIPVYCITAYQFGSGQLTLEPYEICDKRKNTLHSDVGVEAVVAPVSSDAVAFLLHTSGTTSLPKLVPITHGAITANVAGLLSTYNLTAHDVAIHVLPFFHIAGIVIGLLSTLAAGGAVVVVPVFDALSFPQLLREHQVTWFTAVPTIFKSLLEHKGLLKVRCATVLFSHAYTIHVILSFKTQSPFLPLFHPDWHRPISAIRPLRRCRHGPS